LWFVWFIWFLSLFNSSTIEEHRINNLKNSKVLYKSYSMQHKNAITKINTLSWKIQLSKDCILNNSNVWVATECNLLFNK
jgi:hypothetical protein